MRTFKAAALVALVLWALLITAMWRAYGVFSAIAFDFGSFWAGAVVLRTQGASAVYQAPAMAAAVQPLARFYAEGMRFHWGPLSYPPVVMLAIAPLGLLPPLPAFLLWTAMNLAVFCWLTYSLATRFPGARWPIVVAALAFFPVANGLIEGQYAVMLTFAVYRAYLHFERGEEFRAGMWLGILAAKPQYAVVLGLVLLYKRRGSAIAGMAAVGAALAGISALQLGPGGIAVYLDSFRNFSGFRAAEGSVAPGQMINWRALLVDFLPASVTEAQGTALMTLLGALTIAPLALVWRGPWEPRSDRFPMQVFATLTATLLAVPHSHAHGATLLVVPGLVLAARGSGPRALQRIMRVALFAPLLALAATFTPLVATLTVTVLLIASLAVIVAHELRALWRPSDEMAPQSPLAAVAAGAA